MTDLWLFVLIFVGICLSTWILNRLLFEPSERAHLVLVKECLGKQALKHNGTMSDMALTVPHKTVDIEVSYRESIDEVSPAYTYATFRTEVFHDKKFGIYYWKELFLRPAVVIGSRLEVFEEELGETYVVSGDDLSFVKEVLTPEIRNRLLEFKEAYLRVEFGRPHGSSPLSRERGWLSVSAYCASGVMDQDYDRVIETATLFYERLEALNRY